MALLSKLTSKLTLNLDEFRSGFSKARRMVNNFAGSDLAQGAVKIAKWGAAAGAAAAVGLAVVVHKNAEAIDATAKLSDQLGIQTEELIKLRYAAQLSGTENEAFDKSLAKMNRNITEAVSGTGEAASALAALGLDPGQLAAMAPDEQFKTVAESLKGVKSQSDRVALSYKIFGKEGVGLISTLNLGRDGLKQAGDEAERLGIVFNRVDAAKVEAANDAITRVQMKITGAGQALTIGLAPYIEAAANQLLGLGGDGQQMAERIVGGVEWVAGTVAKLSDWLDLLKAGWKFLQGAATTALYGSIKPLTLLIEGVEWLYNKISDSETHFGDGFKLLADNMQGAADQAFKDAGESLDNFMAGKNSAAVKAAFDGIRAEAQKNAEALAKSAQNGAMPGVESQLAALDEKAEKAKKLADALADIDKQVKLAGKSEIDVKLAGLDELGATNAQLEETRKKLEKIDSINAAQDRAKQIKDLMEGLASDVRTFGLTDSEKKLLDLEALGATNDQLREAKDLMDQLASLEKEAPTLGGPSELVFANSARAQQLAFQASRGQARAQDPVPKRSLEAQQRMAKLLESIDRNTKPTAEEEVSL